MDLPIRDRNALLVSAGLRPAFAAHSLDDEQMRLFRMAIRAVLDSYHPYPGSATEIVPGLFMVTSANKPGTLVN